MKHSIYFGAAVALGLLASPVSAQPANPPSDSDAAAAHQDAMHHDAMTRHDTVRHDRMSMHGHMSKCPHDALVPFAVASPDDERSALPLDDDGNAPSFGSNASYVSGF